MRWDGFGWMKLYLSSGGDGDGLVMIGYRSKAVSVDATDDMAHRARVGRHTLNVGSGDMRICFADCETWSRWKCRESMFFWDDSM